MWNFIQIEERAHPTPTARPEGILHDPEVAPVCVPLPEEPRQPGAPHRPEPGVPGSEARGDGECVEALQSVLSGSPAG